MAREVIEKLVDDLDGGEATETVTFALDGTSFEMDLSKKNATAFRKSFNRYIKAARRSTSTGGRRRKPAAQRTGRSRSVTSISRNSANGPARTR